MATATNDLLTGLIIETRFLGPTDHSGSRISAVCKRDRSQAFRKRIGWRHNISPEDNHRAAAEAVMASIEAELAFKDCEPLQIVAYGYGGANDASYFWLINRGES